MPEDEVLTETPESTGTVKGPEGEAEKQATPEADPRYAGKSPEQLVEMLKEKESFIGKQANELGQVRTLAEQVNYLKGLVESRQFTPEAPTPAKPPKAEFDFTNPEAFINNALDEKLGAFQREVARREAETYIRSARMNMERGYKAALGSNKELFAGIENEVQNAVAQQVKGGQIAPELLGDPRTWKAAAALLRITRDEDDKVFQPRKVMSPTDVGSPNRSRAVTEDDDINLTDEDRQFMREYGYDEKTVLDATRRGRQMAVAGKLIGV